MKISDVMTPNPKTVKPTDDIQVYAKTAKGFRSGGQKLRAPTTALILPFEPETA